MNLSYTGILLPDPDTAMSLTTMLVKNKCLAHLDMSYNIFADMITCIFDGLEYNTALRHLKLCAVSDITDTDAEHIARVLESNHSLQTLDITECSFFLGRNGIRLILESLMFNSTLQTLYVNCIDSHAITSFTKARVAKNLPFIDIRENSWQSESKFKSETVYKKCTTSNSWG